MEENQDLLTIIHKVTANQVVKYAESSGDLNPIHLDSAYATTTQFGKRIAHGMLIISFVSDFMYKNFREKWIIVFCSSRSNQTYEKRTNN